MNLNLFIDIQNRALVTAKANDTPTTMQGLFREDSLNLVITLVSPTGTLTAPLTLVDISNLTMSVAVGERDGTANALQATWVKDTTAGVMTFTGNLVVNTTEINDLLTAASGDSIEQYFEVEIQDSGKVHTVLQEKITITKDVIRNSQITPENVAAPSALATSMADILTDGVTVTWSKSGDDITGHIKGLSGLSALTANKIIKVKSDGSEFELVDETAAGLLDGLSDVDTTGQANGKILQHDGTSWVVVDDTDSLAELTDTDTSTPPTDGQMLVWDNTASKWIPSSTPSTHAHTLDSLSDVTAGSPTDGKIIKYSSSASAWILADEGAAQNLWATIESDNGSTTADSQQDLLKVLGGEGVDTSISQDTLTISTELATNTNKGAASFNATNFTVTAGDVTLKNVPISDGGTSSSTKEDAFDSLSPLNSAADVLTHSGSDNIRLAKGTANQVLAVNAGATALEWQDAGGLTIGGSNTQVQFNNSGALGGSADLTWDGNHLGVKNVTFSHSAVTSAATIALDFNGSAIQSINTLTHGVTFSSSNRGAGKCISIRIVSDSTGRTLAFPTGWVFISTKPTAIAASKTAILSLTCYGSADTDIVAAYKEEG